jgi:hypothetical protein
MPKRRLWLDLSEGEWVVLERQTELGKYKSPGNCASAQISRYQESWSDHLCYPSVQQLLAQGQPKQSQARPRQVQSIPNHPQNDPNNPNGF